MIDDPGENIHEKINTVIWKAQIDVGIRPLVQWLNSFDGIVTRYSCEGGENHGTYVQVWVETNNETLGYTTNKSWEHVKKILSQYPSVEIEARCKKGDIWTYIIRFDNLGRSHDNMIEIQKFIFNSEKDENSTQIKQ